MQPIATDGVAWSVRWSVGLSVMTLSLKKAAEPTVMPFGMLTRVGRRNNALDGGTDLSCEAATLME